MDKAKNVTVPIPPAMHAALQRRAEKNGVSMRAYIINATHEAMDRDMFAEMDADFYGESKGVNT